MSEVLRPTELDSAQAAAGAVGVIATEGAADAFDPGVAEPIGRIDEVTLGYVGNGDDGPTRYHVPGRSQTFTEVTFD